MNLKRTESDPLSVLQVFDRLEVGPVKIEPNRVTAPYRLYSEGKEDTIDFVYKFEESVFNPDDPGAQNLAAMMAAQVAMNYGLFCHNLVFHGIYDETDQRFIRDMTENTSREIFVKKFLEFNPFLIGEAASLPAVKRSKYTLADIHFPQSEKKPVKSRWRLWETSGNRHVILSSGGKDSLLSYGLLDEIGKETHPIFVNESGRHWFTAVNAYRYFRENIPHTGRVWVNSDRIFAWILRHMPFIRQDFTNVRSDEYPIRLWTVAVFLFGVLPLVRKRGISRIVIGDEFDTTVKPSFKGISHYDGLYDQSRLFDNAMSRYFMRKGWAASQFSILRPLSEMLIEKILVERYPNLQEHQISCHASHKEGERIRPCGQCEKCRRIVGMLIALGKDPQHCGYTEKQIEDCLKAISEKGVHQESEGAEHLKWMLLKKKKITIPDNNEQEIREHPEILKLRFDSQKSPLDGIPEDLRYPLLKIYMSRAGGAVKRDGKEWKNFNPFKDSDMNKPYAFEVNPEKKKNKSSHPNKTSEEEKYLWSQLTWPEAEQQFKKVDIALLPVGSIEQHGPHLPLDTDAFDADYLAKRIAEACSDPKPLVLPLVSYGVSYEHNEFKGTISISNDALSKLVYEIGMSIAKNGINKLVIINGHGGNNPALNYAAQMITKDAMIFVCVDTGETSDVDIYKITETPNDVHAGEIETSTSLAVRPHLVQMDKAAKLIPKFSSRYLNFTSKRFVSWYTYTKKISKNGVIGDPTKASAKKGEKIWQIMIAHLVSLVEDLKNMTLDEIYQRRY